MTYNLFWKCVGSVMLSRKVSAGIARVGLLLLVITGCARSGDSQKANAHILRCADPCLQVLVVVDPKGSDDPNVILQKTFMTHEFKSSVHANHECPSEVREYLRQAFPKYSIGGATTAVQFDSIQENRNVQERFVDNANRSGISLAYGKIVGQKSGMAGVLFFDAGLGWPREAHTPSGVICHNWNRLKELLAQDNGEHIRCHVYVLRGLTHHKGIYAVTGFDDLDIPEWLSEIEEEASVVGCGPKKLIGSPKQVMPASDTDGEDLRPSVPR